MSTFENIGLTAESFPIVVSTPNTSSESEFRQFTVEQFDRMAEIGVLSPDERVELLEGMIYMMSPIGDEHSYAVEMVSDQLALVLSANYCKWAQQPMATGNSKLQPDGYVARGSRRKYNQKRPAPGDVVLVIEVADSSLKRDRTVKQRIYAAAGIPEYWIINLPERKLEVYRKPVAAAGEQPARYEAPEVFGPEQSVGVVLDGVKIGAVVVRDVLP